jgi:adenosylmethionine-8-amino-7-oxononanoate aminotransferase
MNHPHHVLMDAADFALPTAEHAQGCRIWDTQGRAYIDACSGAITTNLGHQHPGVTQAMQDQLGRITFAYRTQFMSAAKAELAQRLAALSDGALSNAYLVGSGSESVESSLKLALQHFWAQGQAQRSDFVSLRPSYHGSTLGALGVTAYQPLEAPFLGARHAAVNIPSPNPYRKTEANDAAHDEAMLALAEARIVAHGPERIAALIVEPVGGASTGARVLSDRYLQGLRHLCDRHGMLLIFDEVLCGVGRVGSWYAWQQTGVQPDIVALGKGLGAGYFPIGATLCTDAVAAPIRRSGGFMHGHTYAGTPLGCAVANAVLNAIEQEDLLANVQARGAQLRSGLEALRDEFAFVGDVRGRGLLYGVEFVQDPQTREPFAAAALMFEQVTRSAKAHGLLVYPRRSLDGVKGDHVLLCPPLNVDAATVQEILLRMRAALNDLAPQLPQATTRPEEARPAHQP